MANAEEPCRTSSASGGVDEAVKEISLKRKKLPSVSDSAGSSAPTDQTEQRSYASVVKRPEQEPVSITEPAPSSAALGNLAKANGKRLKLDIKSNMEQGTASRSPDPQPGGLLHGEKVPIVRSKPPIPPKPVVPGNRARKQQIVETQNAHTVQKLLAQNEQMRLELSELRSSLAAERNAVRSLRAQNESDLRKTKAECKKLQEALQHHKRNVASQQCQSEQRTAGAAVPAKRAHRGSAEQQDGGWLPGSCTDSRQHQQGLEVLKLNQENSALRETNKFLEEKYQISSEAERRKAADIRVQRDLYELRLTQLSKSAKNEIHRLLEELKSKERTIGQLKKELLQQQQAASTAASTVGSAAGGGCRKERKAAKNSAQQSHEMRKLRETETGSGTISKCNSNNSIQSVNDDYEQLEAKESLELTIVTATTTAAALPADVATEEVVSTIAIDRDCPVTTYRKATRTADLLEIENTTTYGNDVPEQAALPYELCKRTMEAHDDEGSSASSVETKRQRHCVLVHQDALAYEEREAGGRASTKATTPPIDCQQASLESEPDSALSSMSPQPNSFTGEAPENDPWNVTQQQQQGCSRSIQMAARDETMLARIKLELDEMQHRYESLNRDYTAAKDQIDQLEQELVKATQASREQTKLNERIEYLVQREEELLKESHELREQNELLEFRIIELEESHDKWSLRSPNSSPTVGGGSDGVGVGVGSEVKTDGWTDTEKEHDHELIMLSERSDSGVTSPNSHHHLEDAQSGVPSPCDLSLLDQIPTDDVRKRLIAMTKRTCYDEEDKLCMLQILSLLNNLEALSQDHEIAGDDEMSLGSEMPVPKYNHNNYTLPESSTPPKALLHHQPPPTSSTPYKTGTGRIVATVQPFHSTDRLDRPSAEAAGGESPITVASAQPKSLSIASIAETFGGMKKTTRWNNSASLQESGVFVDEPTCTQATQTELEDFPSGLEKTNAELCAEIEKLNRFREKIEECKGVGTSAGQPPGGVPAAATKAGPVALHLPAATGDEECDRRRLQYYVERAETLENKLKVYESSGEQQVRALADRLQRELQLESWVKQLSEKVHQLELDNERLEDERCELEEVENDTRLRLQRLEEDLEVMGQQSVELEMSRNSYQSKYQDAKTTIVGLEELVQKYEEKVFLLEESENDLRERIELIYMFIPMLLLYNSWQLHEQFRQYQRQQQQRSEERTTARSVTAIQCLPLEHMEESYYETNVTSSSSSSIESPDDLQTRLSELMKREKELTQNIAELNRAYNETLENADNLWAQMEREYKEKIGRCEQEEQTLKAKIAQLEERLTKDSEYASERIAHLEETEHGLKARISRLSKENKELSAKHGGLVEEYGALKEDYAQLQNYLRGPAAEALEREKKRVLALEDELAHTARTLRDGEESHRAEVGTLRGRLLAATKELNHIEVTNSELREEVETLEARIRELMTLRTRDDEKIKHLSEELESKQSQLLAVQHGGGSRHGTGAARSAAGRSLAQELERPLKGGSYAVGRRFPDSDGSGSEEKSKFPASTRPLSMAFETKEVKSLAETIILNAESSRAGAKTPKKSFVEEISN
ncbi:uncharacterized protein LOC126572107 [Anopheles aquasalis]|uniref:uncharacterized protein LOC126572107 n=1 Tax=Anopheles aquasalis TaxID=42839 RepID=UPI00215A6DB6|nr:uncharacterized protein LOC126572107 [Anopheles aquasalis]